MVYTVTNQKSRCRMNVIHELNALGICNCTLHWLFCSLLLTAVDHLTIANLSTCMEGYIGSPVCWVGSVSLLFIYEFTVDECLIFRELSFCFGIISSERPVMLLTKIEIVRNWYCSSFKVDIKRHTLLKRYDEICMHIIFHQISLRTKNRSHFDSIRILKTSIFREV